MAQRSWKKRAYLALIGRRLIAGAARVHCTAEAEREQAAAWCPEARWTVLPYVVDLAPFTDLPDAALAAPLFPTPASSSSELPLVLFLSRLHPKKRPELIIEAAAILWAEGFHCQVVIAGPAEPDYLEKLRLLVSRHQLVDRIHFVGMIRGEQKLALFRAADVFVLPTSQENFGLVLIESLACATPIITTQGVDIWQELQEAGATIVTPTAAALAAALRTVGEDRARAKELGERGRQWVFEHLDPVRIGGRFEAMYRTIVEEHAHGSTGSKDAKG